MEPSEDHVRAKSIPARLAASEVLLVAIFPVGIYVLKYLYDLGQSNFYHIPATLLDFSPATLTASMLGIIFALGFAMMQVATVITPRNLNKGVESRIIQISGLLVMTGIVLNIYKSNFWFVPYIFWGLALFEIARHFVFPLLFHRKENSYEEKFRAHIRSMQRRTETISDHVLSFSIHKYSFFVILLISIAIILYSIGYNKAQETQEYYLDSQTSQWVVARFLGQDIVEIRISKNKEFDGEFRIRNIKDDKVTLSMQKLGKIKYSR